MTATGQLKVEHKAVKLVIKILNKISQKINKGEKASTSDIEKILQFLRVFVDKCHHGKEEDLLFPAMEKAGVPNEGGPIGMMLQEHNMGRDFVKGINAALDQYKAGKQKAIAPLIENIKNYGDLLTDHIGKEDNILYQIADMHLGKKEQAELLHKFDKLEEKRIGPGMHEKFHKDLEQLKKAYLSHTASC